MHRLSASLLVTALSSCVLAQPATISVRELRTSIEWVDDGRSVLLKCDSSPTGVCSFEVRLTFGPFPAPASGPAPAPPSAAVGKSVKVFIGNQGANYCATADPANPKAPGECKFITAGFHY